MIVMTGVCWKNKIFMRRVSGIRDVSGTQWNVMRKVLGVVLRLMTLDDLTFYQLWME